MPIRHAQLDDLPEILAILVANYNASIAGRLPAVAEQDGTESDLIILGRRVA